MDTGVRTIGILGAGQLGRMLALAGVPLGVRCRFLDAKPNCPAEAVGEVIHEGFEIGPHLDRFADGIAEGGGVVTYEFENVPVAVAEHLAEHVAVRPSPRSLEVAQDRLRERELFEQLGIDAPRHTVVDTPGELEAALRGFPLPAILKTRRMGYDGKGQARIKAPGDAARAWETIGGRLPAAHAQSASCEPRAKARGATETGQTPRARARGSHDEGSREDGAREDGASGGSPTLHTILDEMIPFERELSMVAVRGVRGEVRCYPPVENVHTDGILTRSIAPAPGVDDATRAEMERATAAIADDLGHVGVLAVEFFETGPVDGKPGRLLANEFAPRVHNTGHWTIEGAETSQFENHLRAVLGMPLGSTGMVGGCHAAMANIIGDWPDRERLLAVPGLHLHDYGKSPRPGRKIGHVTVVERGEKPLRDKLSLIESIIVS